MPKRLPRADLETILEAMEELGLAIAQARARWSPRQRKLYEQATLIVVKALGESVNPSPDEE